MHYFHNGLYLICNFYGKKLVLVLFSTRASHSWYSSGQVLVLNYWYVLIKDRAQV